MHGAGIFPRRRKIYEVNYNMKLIRIIRTTALILALITVFTTTAAALPCDGGDICVNETGWRDRPTDAITDLTRSKK